MALLISIIIQNRKLLVDYNSLEMNKVWVYSKL